MTAHAPRAVLRQDCDRAIMLVGLTGAVVVAWTHLLSGAGLAMNEMDMGGGRVMMMPPAWTLGYATVVFCMWTTMMVAMMLPSAAATILRAASLTQEHPGGMSGTPTAMFFTAGYLMVWTGFSGVATLAQWVLDRVGLLSEAMASRSAIASGAVLIVAGLYEMTSVKQAFLRDSRVPFAR